MRFCENCGALMSKTPLPTGQIMFQCQCQQKEGRPDDTLMDEGYLETDESMLKHAVFTDNSPFDPAANVILKDCPQCGLNFLILTRIGENEITMYSCDCGYRATHTKYMQDFAEAAPTYMHQPTLGKKANK